jgi:hypothetical protein
MGLDPLQVFLGNVSASLRRIKEQKMKLKR